ncbi:MAG: hypothetical protein WCN92_01540 [Eubacteriales bacterium]
MSCPVLLIERGRLCLIKIYMLSTRLTPKDNAPPFMFLELRLLISSSDATVSMGVAALHTMMFATP